MRPFVKTTIVLTWIVLVAAAGYTSLSALAGQGASGRPDEGSLPKDVYPDSRNRLPLIKREGLDERGKKTYDAAAASVGTPGAPKGAAAIRLHGSGVNVRWVSPVGRQLTELAILTTAREHDQPYEWSLHEMEAVAVGLAPSVIDTVRNRKPLTGLSDKEAIVIQVGREIFGTHKLRSETYARAFDLLGKSNLVDLVDLMGAYSGTAARLTAVNQQLPPGWKQFLPLSFTPPSDIYADSRSRLPVIRTPSANPQATPELYSRNLAPEGTGPGQIGRHGAGLRSLEASVGRRLMELAILVTAREHDAQYDWTLHELAAVNDGLEPTIVDIVRHRKPTSGLADREAILIDAGRELFGKHTVSSATYARALKAFGERDLVDVVGLMAQHSADAVLLIAFDQQLPAGQKPLLPMP